MDYGMIIVNNTQDLAYIIHRITGLSGLFWALVLSGIVFVAMNSLYIYMGVLCARRYLQIFDSNKVLTYSLGILFAFCALHLISMLIFAPLKSQLEPVINNTFENVRKVPSDFVPIETDKKWESRTYINEQGHVVNETFEIKE